MKLIALVLSVALVLSGPAAFAEHDHGHRGGGERREYREHRDHDRGRFGIGIYLYPNYPRTFNNCPSAIALGDEVAYPTADVDYRYGHEYRLYSSENYSTWVECN